MGGDTRIEASRSFAVKERREITDCRGCLLPFVKHEAYLNVFLDQGEEVLGCEY